MISVEANVAGAYVANKIWELYASNQIDLITPKALHAVMGAGIGAAANMGDPLKGADGKAFDAVGAELVVENLPISMDPQHRADTGCMLGAVAALIAKKEVNAAVLAGTNAVENNFLNGEETIDEEKRKAPQEEKGAEDALDLHTVDIYQLAQEKTEKDFVDLMVRLERPDGPPTPRIQSKFQRRYNILQNI